MMGTFGLAFAVLASSKAAAGASLVGNYNSLEKVLETSQPCQKSNARRPAQRQSHPGICRGKSPGARGRSGRGMLFVARA